MKSRLLILIALLGLLMNSAKKTVEAVIEVAPVIESAPVITSYKGLVEPAEVEMKPIGYKGNLIPELENDDSIYNGWRYGLNDKWIPGMPSFASQFMVAPEVFTGDVWPYGPNVMEATAEYKGLSLDNVVDGVALMTCADAGGLVWLQRPGLDWEGPFKVVDCARRNDLYNTTVHRDEAVEVGFETAVKWGMATKPELIDGKWTHHWIDRIVEDVIVSKVPPALLEEGYEIVDYSDWFLEKVIFDEFETNQEAQEYYDGIPRMLYRPPVGKEGLPTWRIPPSEEFISFDLTTMADLPVEIETIAAEYDLLANTIVNGKVVVHTPTSVIKSFEVEPDEFWVSVDISEQKLYAHRGNEVIKEFVVSTGLFLTPTPLGAFTAYRKYETYTMAGVEESIPNVKWSTFFQGPYAIHGTYWHSNFGEKMSRGCINMTDEDAKIVYDLMIEGHTRIYVHE